MKADSSRLRESKPLISWNKEIILPTRKENRIKHEDSNRGGKISLSSPSNLGELRVERDRLRLAAKLVQPGVSTNQLFGVSHNGVLKKTGNFCQHLPILLNCF